MQEFFHSVTLDKDKCRGCINCIKRCPTEAIRVRNKKAYIIAERCIDCGECIRVCPQDVYKRQIPYFVSVVGPSARLPDNPQKLFRLTDFEFSHSRKAWPAQ